MTPRVESEHAAAVSELANALQAAVPAAARLRASLDAQAQDADALEEALARAMEAIRRLRPALLGVLVFTAACAYPDAAPSAGPTPTPAPVTTPATGSAFVAPFRIDVSAAGRGHVTPGDIWHGLVTVTPTSGVVSPQLPSRIAVTCPGDSISLPGAFGILAFTCRLELGTHVVTATAETSDGWRASARATVTVSHPPATVIDIHYAVVSSGSEGVPPRSGTRMTFSVPNVAGAWRHHWTFGDGSTDATMTALAQHWFPAPSREREVTVRIAAEDGRTLATGRLVGLW